MGFKFSYLISLMKHDSKGEEQMLEYIVGSQYITTMGDKDHVGR